MAWVEVEEPRCLASEEVVGSIVLASEVAGVQHSMVEVVAEEWALRRKVLLARGETKPVVVEAEGERCPVGTAVAAVLLRSSVAAEAAQTGYLALAVEAVLGLDLVVVGVVLQANDCPRTAEERQTSHH